MCIRLVLLAFCLIAALPAAAHEFWISPDSYELPAGGTLKAEFRVGQEFKGAGYVFIPSRSEKFAVVTGETVTEVTPRVGDRPALNVPAPAEGLNVVVHETGDLTVNYKEFELFQRFLKHKDWSYLEQVHRERGLPETGFKELYRRYAKSLIAVGDGAGSDYELGLDLEIVAVTNPFTADLSHGMIVDVFHYGARRTDAQVEVFEKAPDGAVEIFHVRTNAKGRARFDVKPGHEYLVDSVVIQTTGNEDPAAGAVWRSLWASLTFAVPE